MIQLPYTEEAKTAPSLYQRLLVKLQEEFPKVRICPRSRLWWARVLDRTLLKGSGSFATTLYQTIAVPDDFAAWNEFEKYELLRHERQHLLQFKRWGGGWFPLGFVIVGILYLLVLPTMFTMRAYFEMDAYTQSAVAMIQEGEDEWERQWFIAWMQKTFTGKEYVWMAVSKKRIGQWAEKRWSVARDQAWVLGRDNV